MLFGNMRFKICVFSIIIILFFTSCWSGEGPAQKDSIRHVIVVTIDTLRADHLSIYGYPRMTSPFLSGMAKNGVVFEKCFSASSHTGPSHASLFTSLFPYQHGLLRNGESIYPDVMSMAQVFKDKGYKTGAFSAVNFLKPLSRGFEVFNSDESRSSAAKILKRLKRILGVHKSSDSKDPGPRKPEHGSLVVDKAIEWAQKMGTDEKFFLWVHFFDVHEWEDDGGEFYSKEASLVRRQSSLSDPELSEFFTGEHRVNSDYLSERRLDLLDVMNRYDGRIRYVDSQIKRLFSAIESAKFQGDSLWIITSDHGESLGSHNWLKHGNHLYNEELHVPLIIYFSDGSFTNRAVKQMVRLVDVLPTVMEIVQGTSVNRPIEFEGYSFLPLMRDDSAKFQVKYSFAQRRPADQGREGYWVQGDVYSLQSDNSKYILFSDTEDEFYDLNDDPKELNNLINTTSKEADMMRNQLASEVQRMLRRNPTSAVKPDNKEHLEELRSLGYVQ